MISISMYRLVLLIFLSVLAILLQCSPLPYGFTTSQIYNKDQFGGTDLNGKSIGICPLLRDTGYDSVRFLSSDSHFVVLKNIRKDLHFISSKETEMIFLRKWEQDSLLLFYNSLFKSEIANLQIHDSLWRAISSDYYLVMRLVNASSVKTFNNTFRKRLQAEAELWDCKDQEVVWRTTVQGISLSGKISDSQFILEAVKKAYMELPKLLPSYGNEPW